MSGRPAETAGGVGSIGLLIAYVLGVHDPQTIAIIGAAVGLVPAAVTMLVNNGGVRGTVLKLWRGRQKQPNT